MKIGVISDTHGFLDPKLPALFQGVEHILHGGDVGLPWVVRRLEEIAPVTVVLGNTDTGLAYPETDLVELAGQKFLLHHIMDVQAPAPALQRRILRENPAVVVFGHTHKPFCEMLDGRLYLNPGYAGRQRFSLPRSVSVLEWDGQRFHNEFKWLDDAT